MDLFAQVKQVANIQEVLRIIQIPVDAQGKFLCPFHKEKTPSCQPYPETNTFHCFGCGATGDSITLFAHVKGIKPIEAAKELAKIYNIQTDTLKASYSKKTPSLTLEEFAVNKGFTIDFLKKAGIYESQEYIPKYRQKIRCLIFPYYNMDGSPARPRLRYALKARDGSEWPPKKKDARPIVPYGLYWLRSMQKDALVIVEGETDFLTLKLYHIPALAIPGTSHYKKMKLEYIQQFSTLFIWREPDKAGKKFAEVDMPLHLKNIGYNGQVFIIHGNGIKDLNDLHKICKDEAEFMARWKEIKDNAEPVDLDKLEETTKESNTLDRFFDGKSFVPSRAGEEILEKLHVKKDLTGELYYYEKGVYKRGAETLILRLLVDLLGEAYRPNRADSTVRYIKDKLLAEEPLMDERLINLLNGLFDWIKKELLPHSPEKFYVIQIPLNYNPSAKCPNFMQYLETTFDTMPTTYLIIEYLGLCTIPYTKFQKALMLLGPGGNGKSVLLSVFISLLGRENVCNVSLQDLEENRFAAAQLVGKLANIFADLDSRALQTSSIFKTLVAGDRITVERKFSQPIEYENKARLIFSANELPQSRDHSYAYHRRWIIIEFKKTFDMQTADPELVDKLTNPEELSGIFNLCIDALHRLFSRGQFTETSETRRALEEYERMNNSVKAFCSECVEMNPKGKVSRASFYEAYKTWCLDSGLKPVSKKKIKQNLIQCFPFIEEKRPNKNGPWYFCGILLTGEAYADTDLRFLNSVG